MIREAAGLIKNFTAEEADAIRQRAATLILKLEA
jgi:hypothetical protein